VREWIPSRESPSPTHASTALWFRLIWLWTAARSRHAVQPLGPCRSHFRVSLLDLDIFRHMNDGRYFTIMDLARLDLMRRSGLLTKLNGAGFVPVVTAEARFFRKSLNRRQHFQIDTQVVRSNAAIAAHNTTAIARDA